jgi:hypothetical protein
VDLLELFSLLARKGADREALAERVLEHPGLIPGVLEGLGEPAAAVRYGCAKIIRIVGERDPALLLPHFDLFAGLLDSDNNIMRWEAIHVIGNLAQVDSEERIESILERYLAPIRGEVLITAANVIGGCGRIAAAKPALADEIASHLLYVERAEYQTPECRHVALGHAILAFGRFFDHVTDRAAVLRMVERQLDSPRPATGKKAAKFLKKWA